MATCVKGTEKIAPEAWRQLPALGQMHECDPAPDDRASKRVKTQEDGAAPFRLAELDAGLTEYVHPGWPRVHGIIKQRYADFLVHELSTGEPPEVVRLASLAPPRGGRMWERWACEVEQQPAEPKPAEPKPAAPAEPERTAPSWDALAPFFPPEALEALPKLAAADGEPVVSRALPAKADRTRVHQLVRELGGGRLSSEARNVQGDDGSAAQAVAVTHARGGRGGRNPRAQLDPTSEAVTAPPYIHFTLQKTNRDSQEALQWLSRFMHLGGGSRPTHSNAANMLSVAGTKDKRAVTVQRVSLKRGRKTLEDVWRMTNHIDLPVSSSQSEKRSVLHAASTRAERGLRVAHVAYADQPLMLGQLAGNQFTITLRDMRWVDGDFGSLTDALRERVAAVERDGFVNYFGMQRFGTGAIGTHAVGIAVLQGDYARALELLLAPDENDTEGSQVLEAKTLYRQGKYAEAFRLYPKSCVAERAVLEKMSSKAWSPSDPLGAFQNIPRSLRLMYVHAYQSSLWNRLVSERVRRYGALQPVAGDLVAVRGGAALELGESEFRVLEERDVPHYSMADVVMPMPGTDVQLPGGWLEQMYKDMLAADGLTPASLGASRQPEYRLRGAYRRVVQKPRQCSCALLRYTHPDAPLCNTDEERLVDAVRAAHQLPPLSELPASEPDAPLLALQLVFQLPPSSYATMLLREILRTDTSSHVHKQLTKEAAAAP